MVAPSAPLLKFAEVTTGLPCLVITRFLTYFQMFSQVLVGFSPPPPVHCQNLQWAHIASSIVHDSVLLCILYSQHAVQYALSKISQAIVSCKGIIDSVGESSQALPTILYKYRDQCLIKANLQICARSGLYIIASYLLLCCFCKQTTYYSLL